MLFKKKKLKTVDAFIAITIVGIAKALCMDSFVEDSACPPTKADGILAFWLIEQPMDF